MLCTALPETPPLVQNQHHDTLTKLKEIDWNSNANNVQVNSFGYPILIMSI
jgi:hypothetical protein